MLYNSCPTIGPSSCQPLKLPTLQRHCAFTMCWAFPQVANPSSCQPLKLSALQTHCVVTAFCACPQVASPSSCQPLKLSTLPNICSPLGFQLLGLGQLSALTLLVCWFFFSMGVQLLGLANTWEVVKPLQSCQPCAVTGNLGKLGTHMGPTRC